MSTITSRVTTDATAIPALRHRDTVINFPADQDDFVIKYEANNDHLVTNTVPEFNAIGDEMNLIADEMNIVAGEVNTNAATATSQAGIATTQAGIATTKAGEASTSATNAQLDAWIAEAEAMTAAAYATTPLNTLVDEYTSDGDGTFTATPTTAYSALHWAATIDDGQIVRKSYMTYGGTANAATLTTLYGSPQTAYAIGQQFRFRATATNTGAMTINVDGLGVKTVFDIRGIATVAGEIRTDVDTLVTYDGTNFIADRQIERGSNANGKYVKFADGTQIGYLSYNNASLPVTTAQAAFGFRSGAIVITYPVTFIASPKVLVASNNVLGANVVTLAPGTSTINVSGIAIASGTYDLTFSMEIIGEWK